MNDDEIDVVGRARDSLDNGLAATKLPGLPAAIHLQGLTGIMRDVRDRLNAILPPDLQEPRG